jgi:hypothetical protein
VKSIHSPSGLVHNTVNSSQGGKRLTMVDVVSFMEYRRSLEEKSESNVSKMFAKEDDVECRPYRS